MHGCPAHNFNTTGLVHIYKYLNFKLTVKDLFIHIKSNRGTTEELGRSRLARFTDARFHPEAAEKGLCITVLYVYRRYIRPVRKVVRLG